MYASSKGRMEAMELLLDRGVNVNAKDRVSIKH
jgi:ankyrin repeat protein